MLVLNGLLFLFILAERKFLTSQTGEKVFNLGFV
jgi:hypothetical protein